jgi:hypothetical protein
MKRFHFLTADRQSSRPSAVSGQFASPNILSLEHAMTDSALPTAPRPRLDFSLLVGVFLRPRNAFAQIVAGNAHWLTPMLALTLGGLLYVVVRGFLLTQAAMMGEIPLPQGWEWWSPEMQAQYMQAQQATQSPTFMYVIPALSMLVSLWAGWVIVGGILHFILTLLGGRGATAATMNLVAWSWLPFAVRDILRVVFMLVSQRVIQSAGFSGFAPNDGTPLALYLAALLALVDIFVIWQVILLIIGIRSQGTLSTRNATFGALAVTLLILLVQAGFAALGNSLSGMMITAF